MKKAIYKVPNGKLLKVFLEDADGKIAAITITGDFFLYPEENLEKLEKWLCGVTLSPQALAKNIEAFLVKNPVELFGLDVESLITTILAAQ